jgi:hypothetical protein
VRGTCGGGQRLFRSSQEWSRRRAPPRSGQRDVEWACGSVLSESARHRGCEGCRVRHLWLGGPKAIRTPAKRARVRDRARRPRLARWGRALRPGGGAAVLADRGHSSLRGSRRRAVRCLVLLDRSLLSTPRWSQGREALGARRRPRVDADRRRCQCAHGAPWPPRRMVLTAGARSAEGDAATMPSFARRLVVSRG